MLTELNLDPQPLIVQLGGVADLAQDGALDRGIPAFDEQCARYALSGDFCLSRPMLPRLVLWSSDRRAGQIAQERAARGFPTSSGPAPGGALERRLVGQPGPRGGQNARDRNC